MASVRCVAVTALALCARHVHALDVNNGAATCWHSVALATVAPCVSSKAWPWRLSTCTSLAQRSENKLVACLHSRSWGIGAHTCYNHYMRSHASVYYVAHHMTQTQACDTDALSYALQQALSLHACNTRVVVVVTLTRILVIKFCLLQSF